MSKRFRMIFSLCMGVPAFFGFAYFAGIGAAICLFLIMWADNVANPRG